MEQWQILIGLVSIAVSLVIGLLKFRNRRRAEDYIRLVGKYRKHLKDHGRKTKYYLKVVVFRITVRH